MGNKYNFSFSLDTRQSHRSHLKPLCMQVLSEVRGVLLLVDIDPCKVSRRFLPLLGHSLWNVIFSTNVCFLSGPGSTAFIFQPPYLVQLLEPSCKANIPLTPAKFPLCSLCYTEQDGPLQPHGTKPTFQLLDSFSFSILWHVWPPYLQQDSFTYLVHKAGSRSYDIRDFYLRGRCWPLLFALESGY